MFKYIKSAGIALTIVVSTVEANESIPEPESWSFPQVVESARKLTPKNVEGKLFNKYGLVYSSEEVKKLKFSSLKADEIQKYADIVTHAYPDAVAKQLPASCDNLPVDKLNETAIAGIAYVSIHALSENHQKQAGKCLSVIQEKLSEYGR